MNKIFVIAGDNRQAAYWIDQDMMKRAAAGEIPRRTDYCYVSGEDKLRGYRNPHGVFVGTWRNRHDIIEIVNLLLIQSEYKNDKLRDLAHEVNGNMTHAKAVAIASNQLANDIDREILKRLMMMTVAT
jgi:hypothetical protein